MAANLPRRQLSAEPGLQEPVDPTIFGLEYAGESVEPKSDTLKSCTVVRIFGGRLLSSVKKCKPQDKKLHVQ